MTHPLLSPLPLPNGQVAPNRVWLAPMTNQQSHPDGRLSDDELRWLERRAAGGFGVIETCATHVAADGQGWPGELGIFDDAHAPGWAQLAAAVQAHGAWLVPQLFHGGARARGDLSGSTPITTVDSADGSARAATDDDLHQVVARFRDAATRAMNAGADGVEIHGAHGYLPCQFLSTTLNTREDAWGGDLCGRARLLREITRAVRAVLPADRMLCVRLSPESFGQLTGLDLDESVQVARWLVDDGMDVLHLSLWDALVPSRQRPAVHPVAPFRAALPADVPIVVAGNLWSRADAERCLAEGADAVALGRAAITTPDWPHLVVRDGGEPARPPVTREHLRQAGLGEAFVDYMARWDGFVVD